MAQGIIAVKFRATEEQIAAGNLEMLADLSAGTRAVSLSLSLSLFLSLSLSLSLSVSLHRAQCTSKEVHRAQHFGEPGQSMSEDPVLRARHWRRAGGTGWH